MESSYHLIFLMVSVTSEIINNTGLVTSQSTNQVEVYKNNSVLVMVNLKVTATVMVIVDENTKTFGLDKNNYIKSLRILNTIILNIRNLLMRSEQT